MPKTEGFALSAADTPRPPADAPRAPPRPLADVTCARAQWTPQPAALPTSPLSPSFAMPPPRRLTMRNAGRAVELVLFSLPLQRSGCAQHGNPAATPVWLRAPLDASSSRRGRVRLGSSAYAELWTPRSAGDGDRTSVPNDKVLLAAVQEADDARLDVV